jgi:hypothetical protein
MRTIYIVLFVLIATISLSAINCNVNNSSSLSSQDDKTLKKEERKVEKIDAISMGIAADVKLSQGSPQSIVIEGAARDLEKIITETDGSKLKIRTRPGTWHINKVKIYITMENLKELNISGSGSVNAESPINATDLDLSVSGSGNIEISELSVTNLKSHISGSGSIMLSGKNTEVKSHEMHISGSGDIDVAKLPTQEADIHISGSGNCKVMASNKLIARVSGSGNVYYTGKPVIDARVSGSGKIREMHM